MNLFDTTQLALERAIGGAAQRQTVLGENIANAETPGYLRRDVDFQAALRQALGQGPDQVERVQFATRVEGLSAVRPDGNGVDVDVEAANLAKNTMEYQVLVQAARARIDILRAAMGVV